MGSERLKVNKKAKAPDEAIEGREIKRDKLNRVMRTKAPS